VTPLLYGKQNMGVSRWERPAARRFRPSDFVVFKSIAEQSAFALYNAIIYSEANREEAARSRPADRARDPALLLLRRVAAHQTASR
jgi:GAF domain-containing protein